MRTLVFFFSCLLYFQGSAKDSLMVSSPDKRIEVNIQLSNKIEYSVKFEGKYILEPSAINLLLANKKDLTGDLQIRRSFLHVVNEVIISPVPEKRKEIPDHYTELRIDFKLPYSLLFRVYNDGVAYRWATSFRDSITVINELAEFVFPAGKKVRLPLLSPREGSDRYHTSFEELYQLKAIDSLTDSAMAYNPVLTGTGNEVKLGITESALVDYPGMFISGTGGRSLKGVFAPYPLEEKLKSGLYSQYLVTKRAGYIARTRGARAFPWRVLILARNDKDLPGNDLVYRLGSPTSLKDLTWIHPGKCTDEWIIGINLFNIPFKSGVNTATYKYYIDFAKKFGLDRIMMDAGWSNNNDLFDINPDINMDALSTYARNRGVKISMWTLAATLNRQLDSALKQFNKWGVDFIMTDFMDRDDQLMVNFYHRIAKACADHHIMIMYHGAFAPKGFNRTWPNAITREGVLGSEYNIWSDKPTPGYDVTLPFTRMLAGSLDYEPGILDNATREQFRAINQKVMSQGTRCHQMAMFIVYDSPLQVFSGNPSQGLMEPEFMQLLGSFPTTWDETNILEGSIGEFIVTARKNGKDWYIGGMTNWTPREIELATDRIDPGTYNAVLCRDGINADKYPSDYIIENFKWQKGQPLKVFMAPGGGFVLKLTRIDKQ
ncbi:glycoside hydrolase family 97 protein [Flavisolibacter ginsengisoli]|nr:glycoside hydrolase family 97 protein [Flavisolibacter ginsengisoli]